jgi:uridylate kinase
MYTRVLLKLSGEQLAGKFDSGIDVELCAWLASEIKEVVKDGTQIVIMVVTADNIGMLGTLMNALALSDIFNATNVSTRAISNIVAEQVVDPFTHRRAVSHLQKNRVVIVGGGIGRPYLTTDTAAVSLALELDCQAVLKATKVDGVYDKDPAMSPDARRLSHLSFQDALANDAIKVMDKAALGLAMEHNLPIVVFNALHPGYIARVISRDTVGTTIS